MNITPNANRKHIGIYGNTNSGKSSLMNAILGQDISLVSSVEGTTTDPVQKAMELIPFGPILLIDTAGLEDKSELGEVRIKKSYDYLKRLDFSIYVIDGKNIDIETYKIWKKQANKYNIGHIVVINKIDTLNKDEINNIKNLFENPIFISVKENKGIDKLKEELIKSLEQEEEDKPIVGDLLPYGSKVVLVVPIDSEAPKGRIILPQVQVIRDCLDHGIKTYVVRDTELSQALTDLKDIDLVITDSQAFKEVESIIPSDMKLTSFSILFARQKGEIRDFLEGTKKLDSLKPGDKILICESCTHNVSHEDIGRVKIPNMLKKIAGGDLIIDYKVGYDFKENVEDYDLIIHCGACMVNRKSILNKIKICKEKNVPITNYGMVIAYFTGILNRAVNIF
ncbi:[FeFe] hydrogenase H-cluster maturation GTPase HydF [Paraclostridium sordellii]|uniref:[FeFe] hydrogenase H-cluster maturation GTPase HydF n=1 Tax=Paraclostridium sordellii TaxID=1505 RepID=UPI0005E5AC6A|nr:[FeFe] hydrogenase H-cluster maturation GTPase HydF [Paeniclostridium sordellii]AUN13894.1 [FeFe] hydrogenase H-cluster maturation GTPase HydF [Paeniclostridium sordellii]MBX9180107.1 [FeFe] hydrogenase H-cluster maturation GTPase HydF [Paeniclostridium sordellii]MCQ4696341.1 [FeFe] hydrogenase H-cluster maturation GTPase HydF [Paeniclostridium sordellii]MRZ79841.1 [FeFe] hydrogenase H-cluster maturation GTPase HydF [Paeniclostridium sordellii]MSB60227.1 [FeFe] hydrogenase H-cluster maturat